jgi:outer membrane receptor protein involved in Fe transport
MSMPTTAAFAQDEGSNSRNVETIIVTAQKREESQQDVPLSVAAYDEQIVSDAGVADIKDLISIAPGLMVTSTQSETITTARIRGIGTVGDNFGLESSVGVYIDGVFRARNGVALGDLGEIAGIEVLRGPQGTLFGKNTSAGVLSVSTAQPEDDQFFSVEATGGNYDFYRLAATANGRLSDRVLGRLFAVTADRSGFTNLTIQDANGNNRTTDSETQHFDAVRGQLLIDLTPNAELRLIADYATRDEFCCSAVQWDFTGVAAGLVGAVGGQVLNPADPERRQAFANLPYEQDIEDYGVSAQVDWAFDNGVDMTSVTSLRNWENQRSQDIDYSSADIARREFANNFTEIERFSQELRFNGQNGDLNWLVGGFFSNERLDLGDAISFGNDWEAFLGLALTSGASPQGVTGTISALTQGAINIPFGAALPGGTGVSQDIYEQEATSFALFTHNTYDVTDAFSITAGLRFTREEKDLTASFDTNAPLGCSALEGAFGFDPASGFAAATTAALAGQGATPAQIQAAVVPGVVAIGNICLPYARTGLDNTGYNQSRTDEEISGTIRGQYRFNDDVMGYAGYSRGFKAGGFNLDRQFNGPIGANGYTNVDTSFAPEIVDAFEVGVKSEWLNNALLLNANAFTQTVSDFQLNTFNGVAFVVESVQEVQSSGLEVDFLYFTPIDGLDIQGGAAFVDATYEEVNTGDPLVDAVAGKPISLSPEFYFNGAITYERPITEDLLARFHLDGRWVSDYNTGSDLDPEKEQDAFGLLNARIGLGASDLSWALELWGRNLTDETYAQVAFDAFAQGARERNFVTTFGTSNDARGTAGYDAFLGAPRTYGVTLRKTF